MSKQYKFERLDWGVLDYKLSLERMRKRHQQRATDLVEDAIICVQHPRVFTLGKSGHEVNILIGPQELKRRGISVYHVERGGDITYHGPGQAVVYIVMDIARRRMGVRSMVDAVVGAVCQVTASYGIEAQGDRKNPGAWVNGRKIAAVGMAISKKITLHGLALNVNTDLADFDLIRGCGLEAKATSIEQETGKKVKIGQVFDRLYSQLQYKLEEAGNTL